MVEQIIPDAGKLVELAGELVRAIEDAGRGYSIRLTRLVDGEAEYTLNYRGQVTIHDSHEEASEYRDRLAEQEKVSAALGFLARAQPSSDTAKSEGEV